MTYTGSAALKKLRFTDELDQQLQTSSPAHSRTLTTGKTGSTPNAWCVAPPPRPSGDLLPGTEVVQAAASK